MTPTPKTINDVQSQQKVTTAATNFGVSRPAERVIIVSSLCKSRLLQVCIVKEKKMGWIVSPKISSISESIFQLTQTSSQELNDMGLRARTYVKERYDWNYLGIRMAKIYESLMS